MQGLRSRHLGEKYLQLSEFLSRCRALHVMLYNEVRDLQK